MLNVSPPSRSLLQPSGGQQIDTPPVRHPRLHFGWPRHAKRCRPITHEWIDPWTLLLPGPLPGQHRWAPQVSHASSGWPGGAGKTKDSRGLSLSLHISDSRVFAKQLSNNKSCCFQLQYIDMQPNHTLLVANIVYTWTEPPDVERAFHSRQTSGTRLKSRRHESGCGRCQ